MYSNFKYRLSIIRALLPYTNGIKRYIFYSLSASIIISAAGFIQPVFYKMFVNDIVLGGQSEKMVLVICGYLGVFFVSGGVRYFKNFSDYSIGNNLLLRVKNKLLTSFFSLPFDDYQKTNVGDLKIRLEDDTQQIRGFTDRQSIGYILSFVTLLVSSVLLFALNWKLALFAVVSIPITVWIDSLLGKREGRLNEENRKNNKDLTNWLQESLSGWREIRALCLEKNQQRQYIKHLNKYALYYSQWINYWTARALVIPKIKDDLFMQFGLYFLGGLLIIGGGFTIGELVLFTTYYKIMSDSIRSLAASEADLNANKPHTDRLLQDLANLTQDTTNQKVKSFMNGDIVFDKIGFHYPDTTTEVFRSFSLHIKKGERIAVIGKSGCGKTTLLKLLSGLLHPTSGKITVAGTELDVFDMKSVHNRIGYIMQECVLFNASIRENMKYAKMDVSDEEIWAACEKACISDFINTLPNGLDTVIGEKGIKLSGGQRQRIALAKVFLRDVDIYIFDEATSALDSHNESLIHDAIRQIAADKTIIVVSHRESSLQMCDRIINLDEIQQYTVEEGSVLTAN